MQSINQTVAERGADSASAGTKGVLFSTDCSSMPSLEKRSDQILCSVSGTEPIWWRTKRLTSEVFSSYKKDVKLEHSNWFPCPIVLLFLLCISCADTKIDTKQGDSEDQAPPVSVPKWDTQERADIVVNPLFEAVVENKSSEEINKVLSQSTLSIHAINKKGDTILGTAIQLKNLDMAVFLLTKFTCEDLSHQNNKGESYVYLSAKHGYEDLIHGIAKKCFENSLWWPDYEFSDLDPKTTEGETRHPCSP